MRNVLISISLAAITLNSANAIEYTPSGELVAPVDFREWVFLTSSLDLNYNEPVPGAKVQAKSQLDNVFANPAAYQSFMKMGTWPDETVLVKENRHAIPSADEIGKSGKVQGDVLSTEFHVKDQKRYAAQGGWAFFVSDGKTPTARLITKASVCQACHEAHGKVDDTFVQFYPTLADVAKAKGTFKKN